MLQEFLYRDHQSARTEITDVYTEITVAGQLT
jgi:hypothetical protein